MPTVIVVDDDGDTCRNLADLGYVPVSPGPVLFRLDYLCA
jgi:hypothetical protein